MAGKFKVTGFARFFILMLFLAPLAYLGASYYNGEDGLQKLKDLLGIDKDKHSVTLDDGQDDDADVAPFQEKLEKLNERVDELERKNEELTRSLEEKEVEIQELKEQIKNLK